MIEVATRDECLQVARDLVETMDAMLLAEGERAERTVGYTLRLLRRIAGQALAEPSLLDDEEGRRDFAEALREALPAVGGRDPWNDDYPHWRDRILEVTGRA